jgi:hypothetical protein
LKHGPITIEIKTFFLYDTRGIKSVGSTALLPD